MRNLVGKRVRCISTGKIYRTVHQAGEEIVCSDEKTSERIVLPIRRVVQHSPFLLCIGATIQTVLLANYEPLGDSAHLIRGGFFGSLVLAILAWLLGMSTPVVIAAYMAGGLIGLAISATHSFRVRTRRKRRR